MKRGEVWTVAGGGEFTGKPRPVVVVQDDLFAALRSVAICLLTSETTETHGVRPLIEPTDANGLRALSQVMIDKITAVSRSKLRTRIGRLSDHDMLRVNRAIVVFLGLSS